MTDRLTKWEGRDKDGPRAVMVHRDGNFAEAFEAILRKLARLEDVEERKEKPAELYVKYDAGGVPIAYAYGEEWVAQALYMDDIGYKTSEEAIAAWEKENEKRVTERP